MRVLAIDPSLSGTGLAVLDTAGPFWSVGTLEGVKFGDGPRHEFARMHRLASGVMSWVDNLSGSLIEDAAPIGLIVIEAPAFSKNTGMAHERAGLWWKIYERCLEFDAPILVIKPNVRAKYATGRGNAGKDEVMLAAARRYADAPVHNNNEADAVVLAAMGARYGESPIEASLPAAHLEAMRTVGSLR